MSAARTLVTTAEPTEDHSHGPAIRALLESRNPAVRRILGLVHKVGRRSGSVLITGESGTGKEVLARVLHRGSDRRAEPFVAVNCAAIPGDLLEAELFGHERGAFTGARQRRVGRFEAAMGGTLLLDEVGDLPLPLQAKLLRVLQEREFEALGSNRRIPLRARVLAATSQDLLEAVADGRFREDLFYRLAVFHLELPALRDRVEDLPAIARALLSRDAARANVPPPALSPEALESLAEHDWPGNVRELENVLLRAALEAQDGVIRRVRILRVPRARRTPDWTAGGLVPLPSRPENVLPLSRYESLVVEAAFQACDGNLSLCARKLGVARGTLRRKLENLLP